MGEAADEAEWRHNRLTTEGFIKRQIERGLRVSPIFAVFGTETKLFRVDWLHCVDAGVGADFVGNVFEALFHKLEGNTIKEKCNTLNDKVQDFYERRRTPDRIKTINHDSFKRKSFNQPSKMKGSAAQVRCLIPFVKEFIDEVGDDGVPREFAMKTAAKHLKDCYQCLSKSSDVCRDVALHSCSQAFVLQCEALHATGDGVAFRSKPKTHMFLEMCSQSGGVPTSCWCYRDEDWGGPIARQSRERGRWKHLTFYSRRVFDSFFMNNPVPRITKET